MADALCCFIIKQGAEPVLPVGRNRKVPINLSWDAVEDPRNQTVWRSSNSFKWSCGLTGGSAWQCSDTSQATGTAGAGGGGPHPGLVLLASALPVVGTALPQATPIQSTTSSTNVISEKEVLHPQRIPPYLPLGRIINDVIGNVNLAVAKLHPA